LIPGEGTLRCYQDLIFATEIGKVAPALISLRSLACLANDYAIAGVGRLYLCVDVAPVEARSATGTVEGISVVRLDSHKCAQIRALKLGLFGCRVESVLPNQQTTGSVRGSSTANSQKSRPTAPKRWRLILNVGRIQRGRGRPHRGAYLLAPRAPIPGARLSTGWQLRHEGITSAVEGCVEGACGSGVVGGAGSPVTYALPPRTAMP
jgi:hypothetical protein